ncbi:MAG TPA: hypothetical protein VFI47_28135 [Acidimicrobiales bacterium]|nr:hypothetical protein [Acidimicrobiales bacterium]
MDRDDGAFDWDAAFFTLVAPLRPHRYLRAARVVWQTAAAFALVIAAGWVVMRMVVEPLGALGRPVL